MLLVHHVAAHHPAVVIDDDGTVLTFADGTDDALRHTHRIVGIAEFEEQLLLLVVGHDALVGDSAPEVLMTVYEDHRGDGLDTHPGEILLHVALEGLCLRMIDTVT